MTSCCSRNQNINLEALFQSSWPIMRCHQVRRLSAVPFLKVGDVGRAGDTSRIRTTCPTFLDKKLLRNTDISFHCEIKYKISWSYSSYFITELAVKFTVWSFHWYSHLKTGFSQTAYIIPNSRQKSFRGGTYNCILFFFWPSCMVCGILVPWPGIELGVSSRRMSSPNHWTAREFPLNCILKFSPLLFF